MRRFESKILLIYGAILAYVYAINTFSLNRISYYSNWLNPLIWISIFVMAYLLAGDSSLRIKNKFSKIQTGLILAMMYLIIYFSIGLIFGYKYSPYSTAFTIFLRNLWAIVGVLVFQEQIRAILVRYQDKRKLISIVLLLIFTSITLDFNKLFNAYNNYEEMFKFTFGTIMPLLATNALYLYIAFKGGIKPLLVYRAIIGVTFLLVPIFPDLDWFILGLFETVFAFTAYLIFSYEDAIKEVFNRKRKKPLNPILYLPLLLVMVSFIGFVIGFFKYMPIAVLSNSMYPSFSRGDVVIVEKINQESLLKIQIDDIIEYRLDNHIILHRVVDILEIENKLYFMTKGDNNNAVDDKLVKYDQIQGIVRSYIPRVGYPTIWLSELFTGEKPDIEMGR